MNSCYGELLPILIFGRYVLIGLDRSKRCDLACARFGRYVLIGLSDVLGQLVFGGSIEAF